MRLRPGALAAWACGLGGRLAAGAAGECRRPAGRRVPRAVPLHGAGPLEERPAAAVYVDGEVPLLLPVQRRLQTPIRRRTSARNGGWRPRYRRRRLRRSGRRRAEEDQRPTTTSGRARRSSITAQHRRLRRGRGGRCSSRRWIIRRPPAGEAQVRRRSSSGTRRTAAGTSRPYGDAPVIPNAGRATSAIRRWSGTPSGAGGWR